MGIKKMIQIIQSFCSLVMMIKNLEFQPL